MSDNPFIFHCTYFSTVAGAIGAYGQFTGIGTVGVGKQNIFLFIQKLRGSNTRYSPTGSALTAGKAYNPTSGGGNDFPVFLAKNSVYLVLFQPLYSNVFKLFCRFRW